MNRLVVIVSVNGRPSAISWSTVRAKLSLKLCRMSELLVSWMPSLLKSVFTTWVCWNSVAKNESSLALYWGSAVH